MNINKISTRDFRENLKDFFDKAEAGETVFIQRKNQSFILLPVEEDIEHTKETALSHLKEHYRNVVKETAREFIHEEVQTLLKDLKSENTNL